MGVRAARIKRSAKKRLKELFHVLGLEISRYRPDLNSVEANPLGSDPFSDIKRLLHSDPAIIFDVGANRGQSVMRFKELMPECQIHVFEPSPTTYGFLTKNVRSYRKLYLNNLAVGSSRGEQTFLENSQDVMSSFLPPSEFCWGEIIKETTVSVTTLDRYCEERGIPYISLLKTDTQGYDFEVLKGAEGLMREGRIELVFMEVIFSDMYKDLPAFDETYRFLLDRGFKLISFYQFYHQQEMASWSDALFRSTRFHDGNERLGRCDDPAGG